MSIPIYIKPNSRNKELMDQPHEPFIFMSFKIGIVKTNCGLFALTKISNWKSAISVKLITEATHVKSHQADSGNLPAGITEEEAITISGNQVADQLATDTLEAHPEFDKHFWDKAEIFRFPLT